MMTPIVHSYSLYTRTGITAAKKGQVNVTSTLDNETLNPSGTLGTGAPTHHRYSDVVVGHESPAFVGGQNSVWRSSLKTRKRPRPDRTKTDQDQKFSRPIKTVTMVRSAVHRHSQKLKTGQRPVLAVSTGFSALKYGRSQAWIFLF